MLYAIIASDVANSLEQRLAARPAHLARLEQLKSEGRLVLADSSRVLSRAEADTAKLIRVTTDAAIQVTEYIN